LVLADCTEWHRFRWRLLLKWHFYDMGLLREKLHRDLDALIGISDFWSRYAASLGLPCAVVPSVLHPRIRASLAQAESQSSPVKKGGFTLTYCGILAQRELPKTMFEACRLAARKIPGFKLNIVGNISQRHTGNAFRRGVDADSELRAIVHWHGRVSDNEYPRLLLESNAFILLRDNRRESQACFATRLPEYLYAGKPLVASDSGNLLRYLKHRVSAVLIPESPDPSAIAVELEWLASHPEEARQIGVLGRRAAEGPLSPREGTLEAVEMIGLWTANRKKDFRP